MKRQKSTLVDQIKPPTGRMIIRVRDPKTGKVVKTVEDKNLIVSNFRSQTLFALAGGSLGGVITDWELSRAQLGTSGVAAAVGDTVITAPVEIALTSTYPASKVLQLNGTLGAALGVGVVFQEAGLLFTGAGLAARRVFAPMTKTATFEWDVEWILTWP